MHKLTVISPEAIYFVQVPVKPRFHTGPCSDTLEVASDDLAGIDRRVYRAREIISLAETGQQGFAVLMKRDLFSTGIGKAGRVIEPTQGRD